MSLESLGHKVTFLQARSKRTLDYWWKEVADAMFVVSEDDPDWWLAEMREVERFMREASLHLANIAKRGDQIKGRCSIRHE